MISQIDLTRFFFLLTFLSSSVFAGGHLVGNTSSFLLCTHAGQASYHLYDVYEAQFSEGPQPDSFDYGSGLTYLEKAKSIISRLANLNPTRYQLYLKFINSFPERILIKTVTPKNRISNDNTLNLIPHNCELIPVIINNMNYYTIDGEVWPHLTESQKAALLVHEVIYNEALMLENSHQNSYFVRVFTRHLLANSFKNMSLKEYHQFIQSIQFTQADAHGFSIALNSYNNLNSVKTQFPVEYWDEHSVKKANLYWNGQSSAYGISLKYNFMLAPLMMNSNSFVSFHPNHQIEIFKNPIQSFLYDPYELNKINLSKIGFSGEMAFNYIHFSAQGKIASVKYLDYFPGGSLLKLDYPELKMEIAPSMPLSQVDLEVTPFRSIQFANISKNICQEQLLKYSTVGKQSNAHSQRKFISLTLKQNVIPSTIEKLEWCE